jgi:hypothetical protein
MLGRDINQKPLGRTCYSRFVKIVNSPIICNGPFKFLSILRKTHSNSPFYWNMDSVNTGSIPNYTKHIPGCIRYIPKVSEMLQIKLEHKMCYTRHNQAAKVNTICIPTPSRSSHITVGMHLVQDSHRTK